MKTGKGKGPELGNSDPAEAIDRETDEFEASCGCDSEAKASLSTSSSNLDTLNDEIALEYCEEIDEGNLRIDALVERAQVSVKKPLVKLLELAEERYRLGPLEWRKYTKEVLKGHSLIRVAEETSAEYLNLLDRLVDSLHTSTNHDYFEKSLDARADLVDFLNNELTSAFGELEKIPPSKLKVVQDALMAILNSISVVWLGGKSGTA